MATTPHLVWMQSSRLLHSNHQTRPECVCLCVVLATQTHSYDNNRPSATECNHTPALPQIVNMMHLCLLPSAPLNLQLCNGQRVNQPPLMVALVTAAGSVRMKSFSHRKKREKKNSWKKNAASKIRISKFIFPSGFFLGISSANPRLQTRE